MEEDDAMPDTSGQVSGVPGALLTDLYELTMMAGYHAGGWAEESATFDLFHRHPPEGVDIVVAAGLDLALDYLERLRFTDEELDYLATLGRFDQAFLDYLKRLRFSGEVWAVPEGLPVFADEPILRVTAPLAQAQLVETALLNLVSYSSLVASTALQISRAARGKPVLEFGARRAHGPDGALTGARAAMIGGCASTSNVEAGRRFGVPVSGTMAHSWVMRFPSELDAFRAFVRVYPDDCILLVDTYDTIASGVPHAIVVGHELRQAGHRLSGIRLDSGDLDALARQSRRLLDDAGLDDVRILASGDLDAERVAALEAAGAPIDGYGVGTALITAARDPKLSAVYKLVEAAGQPVLKISSDPGKTTNPGRKQVWRSPGSDVIGLEDELLEGEPLLVEVMHDGRRTTAPVPVLDLRARCAQAVTHVHLLVTSGRWTVRRSPRLEQLRATLVDDLHYGVRPPGPRAPSNPRR
jgi:nicotinate phosphoribosyltransferase